MKIITDTKQEEELSKQMQILSAECKLVYGIKRAKENRYMEEDGR